MSDHLPECLVPDFTKGFWVCICKQLRRCAERIRLEDLPAIVEMYLRHSACESAVWRCLPRGVRGVVVDHEGLDIFNPGAAIVESIDRLPHRKNLSQLLSKIPEMDLRGARIHFIIYSITESRIQNLSR